MYSFIGRTLTKKQIEDAFLDHPYDSEKLRKYKATVYLVLAYLYDFHTGAQVKTIEHAALMFNLPRPWIQKLQDRGLYELQDIYLKGRPVPGKVIDYR